MVGRDALIVHARKTPRLCGRFLTTVGSDRSASANHCTSMTTARDPKTEPYVLTQWAICSMARHYSVREIDYARAAISAIIDGRPVDATAYAARLAQKHTGK